MSSMKDMLMIPRMLWLPLTLVSVFEDNDLVIKEELIEDDKKVPDDEITMKVLQDIANSIYQCV